MPSGGYRPGAGKKPGSVASHTIQSVTAKQRIVDRVSKRVDELVDALFVKAIVRDIDEKIISVDVAAVKELLDRAYGRPAQAVEMTGKDGEDLFPKSDLDLESLAKELALRIKEKKT